MICINSASNHRLFAANNNNSENTQQRHSTVLPIECFTRVSMEGHCLYNSYDTLGYFMQVKTTPNAYVPSAEELKCF